MRVLVVVAAIAFAVFLIAVIGIQGSEKTITKEDAIRFVETDIRTVYASPKIEFIDIRNESNSWQMTVAVTEYYDTPCPRRVHLSYDYPRYGFVYRFENITSQCRVCYNEGECIISFPEEALIASHTDPNANAVREFFEKSQRVRGSATFYPEYSRGNSVYTNVWLVTWTNEQQETISVLLQRRNGTVLETFTQ